MIRFAHTCPPESPLQRLLGSTLHGALPLSRTHPPLISGKSVLQPPLLAIGTGVGRCSTLAKSASLLSPQHAGRSGDIRRRP
jgi:hypothetical protein